MNSTDNTSITLDAVGLEAAWNRLKDFLFVQGAMVETRPIAQGQMRDILTYAIRAYLSAAPKAAHGELPPLIESPIEKAVRIKDDMNPKQCLDIWQQDDGDLILTIWNNKDGLNFYASMELCTAMGGGKHHELFMLLSKFLHNQTQPKADVSKQCTHGGACVQKQPENVHTNIAGDVERTDLQKAIDGMKIGIGALYLEVDEKIADDIKARFKVLEAAIAALNTADSNV